MTEWLDPVVIIGVVQVIAALALVYYTISLARSTKHYSAQVERQTGIMDMNNKLTENALKNAEKNAERERLLKKYERLTNEMVNFVAPLYSRVGDMQVFDIDVPKQKITEWHCEQIEPIPYETYSFWENIRRNIYLNQSDHMERMLNNYFAVIDTYRDSKKEDSPNKNNRELLDIIEQFKRNRVSLFNAITTRYSELEKELKELEKELGINEK